MNTYPLHYRKYIAMFRAKKVYYILIAASTLFFLIFFLKGCSKSPVVTNSYHIGRDNSWPSAHLLGKERNFAAFSDDLLAAIALQEKLTIQLSQVSTDQLISRLTIGQVDGILSNQQPSSESEENFLFSEPYFLYGPVLIVRVNSELDTWSELKYRIIGVLEQSPLIFEITKKSSIQMKLYDNVFKALSDLEDKYIDGAILPALQAYIYTRTFYPNRLRVVTTPLTTDGFRLIALKNEKGQKLINAFNSGLNTLKRDGTYDSLIINWGLVNSENVVVPQS